jgi:hypothetical protein
MKLGVFNIVKQMFRVHISAYAKGHIQLGLLENFYSLFSKRGWIVIVNQMPVSNPKQHFSTLTFALSRCNLRIFSLSTPVPLLFCKAAISEIT